MPVVAIARFAGNVDELRRAYDRAHELIMAQPGPPIGEVRHHCALGEDALYLIGVWESEERIRTRFASPAFEELLESVGFPSPKTAEVEILQLHATEPPFEGATRVRS
jgi:quinol monooxygenase YgiN